MAALPNIITTIRIILVPVYLIVFFQAGENYILYSGLVFILAGISDFLDGYIARKYDLQSKTGAVLDPLADKLMTFAVLISLTYGGLLPPWILLIIGLKEVFQILGGVVLYFFKEKIVIPSNKFGKLATVLFYGAVLSLVFNLNGSFIYTMFILTVIFNIIAFINYLKAFLAYKANNFSSTN